jgi:hypothetical protein
MLGLSLFDGFSNDDHKVFKDPFGPEKIVNGGFSDGSIWVRGAGYTISGGKLVLTNVAVNVTCYQEINAVVGKTYRVSYEVSNYSSGSFVIRVGNFGNTINGNGNYVEYIYCSGAWFKYCYIWSLGSCSLKIDNVSVKLIL